MDHLTQAGIFVLEELGDSKEERRGLVGRELLARVQEQGDLGEEDATFSRLDRGAVEEPGYCVVVCASVAAHPSIYPSTHSQPTTMGKGGGAHLPGKPGSGQS